MDARVLNFKKYDSGSLAGFFDLAVGGLTVTGCKAFCKEGNKFWFAWPSEKLEAKDGGEAKWRDIVTASEPVMRHIQGLVRPQLRALILGNAGGTQPSPHRQNGGGSSARSGSAEHGDRAYQDSRRAAQADSDIPF
jgi:hypothetical protein